MNFIIEILPKRENGNQFSFVVRRGDGLPIAVCETLDGAKEVIQQKFDELRKQSTSNA